MAESNATQNPPSPEREWQEEEIDDSVTSDAEMFTEIPDVVTPEVPLRSSEHDLLRESQEPTAAADRRRKIVFNVLRVIFILGLTLALLLLWQGVAHSQDSDGIENDPSWLFNDPPAESETPKPAVTPVSTPTPTPVPNTPSNEGYKKTAASGDPGADMRALIATLEKDPAFLAPAGATRAPNAATTSTSKTVTNAEPQRSQPKDASNMEPSSSMVPPANPTPAARNTRIPLQKTTFHPKPVEQPIPLRGTPMLGDQVSPLSKIDDDDLLYTSTLELALAFDQEFADREPPVNPRILRGALYQHLVELSVEIGFTDNPRDNLEAVRVYLFDELNMTPVVRTQPALDLLLPRQVLSTRRGAPATLALLALLLADRVNDYLRLEPVLVDDVLGLRYRSGYHRYTLVPSYPDRLYSDREFVTLVRGSDGVPTSEEALTLPEAGTIRVLTRKQFWGLLCAEAGEALLNEKLFAWGATLVDRGLTLYNENPRAHIAKARVMLEQNDPTTAREELDTAVSLNPDSLDARLRRVDLLESQGMSSGVEEDLLFVAQRSSDPLTTFRLIEFYLSQKNFALAQRISDDLRNRQLPPSVKEQFVALDRRVAAAPWIEQLDARFPPADRFEAVQELRGYPLREVKWALLDLLEDDNLRLAHLAWKTLGELTHFDLPRERALWARALEQAEAWENKSTASR